MGSWIHIILEGYCTRKYSTKKDKYVYECTNPKKMELKKIPNKDYDPNYRTPKKPSYCIDVPRFICLEKNCKHFGYCDAELEDYLWMNKKYKKSKKLEE